MSRLEYFVFAKRVIESFMHKLAKNRDLEFIQEIHESQECIINHYAFDWDIRKSATLIVYPGNAVCFVPNTPDTLVEEAFIGYPTDELFTLCESLLKDKYEV